MSSAIHSPVIGPYELQEEWGKNGLGTLYLAHHKRKNHLSLVQVLSPQVCNRENFIVRFELLKTIAPTLSHPNLLKVEMMGLHQNLYFIAKEFPGLVAQETKTLADIPLQDLPKKYHVLSKILYGVAEGLAALEEFSQSYYREGIPFLNFHPSFIYLCPKKGSLYSWDRTPKLDGFFDPFLSCGDGPTALFSYHIQQDYPSLYKHYLSSPHPSSLSGEVTQKEIQVAFGSYIYEVIANQRPIGNSPSLKSLDPLLPNRLENLCTRCLGAARGEGYSSFKEIAKELQTFSGSRPELTKEEQTLQDLVPPDNMSLISLQDKAILGASDGPSIEQPSFKARIKPFFLDRAPVTNEQFSRFRKGYKRSTYSKADDSPATLLSLEDAQAYCDFRSELEGLPKGTYRLPTEYEWEAAVRGSSGQLYPWGSSPDPSKAHCGFDQAKGTCGVYAYPPGRFFLYSMLGNTWEWTSSSLKPHPFANKELTSPNAHLLSVVKGGCWLTPLDRCRASLRAAYLPSVRKGNIGFRCARDIDSTLPPRD